MNHWQKILLILLTASVLLLGIWVYTERSARNVPARQGSPPSTPQNLVATNNQSGIIQPKPQQPSATEARYAEARNWIALAQNEAASTSGDAKRTVSEELAKAQAEIGDIDGALQTAQRMSDDQAKVACLLAIIRKQIALGDVSGSRRTVEIALKTVQGATDFHAPYSFIFSSATKSGDIDGVLGDITKTQASAGDVDGARETVESIKDTFQKIFALDQVAIAQYKAGDIKSASETLLNAFRMTENEPVKSSYEPIRTRDDLFRDIATAKAVCGDIVGALQLATSIDDSEDKALALSDIASLQADAGDNTASRETFQLALRSAEHVPKESSKSVFFSFLKAGLIKAGIGPVAVQSAQLIRDNYGRCEALRHIARAQAQAGDLVASRSTLSLAIEAASTLDNSQSSGRNDAARDIAGAEARIGDISAAIHTASVLATDSKGQLVALCYVAGAQAEAGDVSGAIQTRLLVTSHTYNTADTSCAIAAAQARAGDSTGAKATIMSLSPGKNRCGGYLAAAYGILTDASPFLPDPEKPFRPNVDQENATTINELQSAQPTVARVPKARIQSKTLANWKLYFTRDAKISSMINEYGKPDTIDTGDSKTVYLWYHGLDYGANDSGILRVRVARYQNELIVVSVYDGYNELTATMPWAQKVLGTGDFGLPNE